MVKIDLQHQYGGIFAIKSKIKSIMATTIISTTTLFYKNLKSLIEIL